MTRLLAVLPIFAFVAALTVFGFAYGVAVGHYQLFPYDYLTRAKLAVTSLIEAERQKSHFVEDFELPVGLKISASGLTTHDPEQSFAGPTFMTAFNGEYFEARLVDMAGAVLHTWQTRFSEVFPDPTHVEYRSDDSVIALHGSWLYPNGDVLLTFVGGNFPYGGGLVKLDRDSNVEWAVERNTHHDIHVTADGTIVALAHIHRSGPPPGLSATQEGYLEEVVLMLSPDGEVVDEFSILAAIRDSDFRGLLSLNYRDSEDIHSPQENLGDPFHANTIEVLSAEDAANYPMFEAGDYLISLRNINMIGVISQRSRQLVWALTGIAVRQHDPDFTESGTIMLYDNRGHAGPGGRARLLEIDPATQRVVWRYPGSEARPFEAFSHGKMQVLPNDNVLAIAFDEGRVFEVTRAGDIVWEYRNVITTARGEAVRDKVGWVTDARRVEPQFLTFLQ